MKTNWLRFISGFNFSEFERSYPRPVFTARLKTTVDIVQAVDNEEEINFGPLNENTDKVNYKGLLFRFDHFDDTYDEGDDYAGCKVHCIRAVPETERVASESAPTRRGGPATEGGVTLWTSMWV